ncbi:recombinase family protein [Pelagibius sp.]|uniref:recombinase family protein n=1 Tax=Pelagibius sp. TaxID=1931238 RepID=UPI00346126FB
MRHRPIGTSVLRPAYQKLLTDAQGGAFEVVVAESLDRLSHDRADVASLCRTLSFRGTRKSCHIACLVAIWDQPIAIGYKWNLRSRREIS